MIARELIEAGVARSMTASLDEAVAITAMMHAMAAQPIYAVFSSRPERDTERRVRQVQDDFLRRYEHNPQSVQALAGRLVVDAYAMRLPDNSVAQGMAVWLLPRLRDRAEPQQLVLPLDLSQKVQIVANR